MENKVILSIIAMGLLVLILGEWRRYSLTRLQLEVNAEQLKWNAEQIKQNDAQVQLNALTEKRLTLASDHLTLISRRCNGPNLQDQSIEG